MDGAALAQHKYERVYLKAYDSVSATLTDVADYLTWFNTGRPRSSLSDAPPDEYYFAKLPSMPGPRKLCSSGTPRDDCHLLSLNLQQTALCPLRNREMLLKKMETLISSYPFFSVNQQEFSRKIGTLCECRQRELCLAIETIVNQR